MNAVCRRWCLLPSLATLHWTVPWSLLLQSSHDHWPLTDHWSVTDHWSLGEWWVHEQCHTMLNIVTVHEDCVTIRTRACLRRVLVMWFTMSWSWFVQNNNWLSHVHVTVLYVLYLRALLYIFNFFYFDSVPSHLLRQCQLLLSIVYYHCSQQCRVISHCLSSHFMSLLCHPLAGSSVVSCGWQNPENLGLGRHICSPQFYVNKPPLTT